MTNYRIIFTENDVSLPDGACVGIMGEHNAVRLVITLPDSMINGMDYHTVTIGSVESALITDTEANVDGAYRVGNTIYQPMTAAYTTQKFVSVFVTAYKQTDAVPEIVDKTPTVYGLHFSGGAPRPIPGGIAAQVAALEKKVNELLETGVEVVEELPEYPDDDAIVYLKHTGFYWYSETWVQLTDDGVGMLELSQRISEIRSLLPNRNEHGVLTISDKAAGNFTVSIGNMHSGTKGEYNLYIDNDGKAYLRKWDNDNNVWNLLYSIQLTPQTIMTLAKISERDGKILFAGKPIASGDEEDDVTLLALEAYDALYLRDDFTGIGTLDDVPIYVLDNVGYGFGLYEDENNPSTCDSVSVGEVVDDNTGLPVRFIRAFIGGTNYARWSRDCTVDGHDFSRGVWYTNNTATAAPSFAGFTPTALEVCGEWYDDLSDLPDKAASALRSLSQLVNVSAAAMGTIRVQENAVQRFAGTLKDGMHFSYAAHDDITLDFPDLPWTDAASVMLLDLHCMRDIALTLPREKLLDGGTLPNTTAGNHTLTFTYVPASGKWSVGCVNRVQPQYWDDIPDTVIPLEDCTWAQIKSIAEHGYLNRAGQWCIRRNNEEEVWFEIGDEKTVALSTGETWTMQLWDFNHDDLADGSDKAPFTFGMSGVTSDTYRINNYNTINGGWEVCDFRTQTLSTIIQTLPSDLQSVLADVLKSSVIEMTRNSASTRVYTSTTDTLFLPTWTELGGSWGQFPGGDDGGSRYAIFNAVVTPEVGVRYALRSIFFASTLQYQSWEACGASASSSVNYIQNITDPINMRLAFCI